MIVALLLAAIPWVDVPAVRTVDASHGPVYADILCRVPSNKTYDGNAITIAHETVHAVNALVGRQALARLNPGPGVFLTGLYAGSGKAAVFAEPRITKSQVLACAPSGLIGPQSWYLSGNADSESLPLVLLDEWTAFTLASESWIEQVEQGIWQPTKRGDWVSVDSNEPLVMLEFNAYAVSVLEAVTRFDPEYPQRAELTEFVNYQIGRTACILRRIQANGKSASPRQLELWRAFCEALKGGAWPGLEIE